MNLFPYQYDLANAESVRQSCARLRYQNCDGPFKCHGIRVK
jgi:hypothetical protein